jgi:ABC-type multidrug transport system permease subunit
VEVLPGWLRAVGNFIPLTYALDVARRALLGGGEVAGLGKPFVILGVFAVVSLAVGGVSFRWALARAKRDGSLSQY